MTPVWTLSLILGFSLRGATLIDAKYGVQPPKPILTLVVRDLIDSDPTIRAVARTEAIRILNKAGIELQWIDANGTEDPQFPPTIQSYATVVIAAHPPAGWTSPGAMGFAPARTGCYVRAYVFSDLINDFLHNFTTEDKSAFGIILGHAIAHELGHLLISGDAHGPGIMQPKWGYREWQQALEGSLLFVPGHARALQTALQTKGDHSFIEFHAC